MVIGGPGSGKSTLARRLGDVTGLPVVHMDHIHHLSGWKPRPMAEKLAMHDEVVARERWIFEGGLSKGYASRAARAELIVFLDVPVVQRLYRVTKRTLQHYGRTRPDLPDGCPEQFSGEFFWWIVSTARKNRLRDLALVERHAEKGRVLRSSREVARFVEEMAA